MGKLKHYGIRDVAYNWFVSYLKERKQYVSINGNNFKNLSISLIVFHMFLFCSALISSLLNDLHTVIKFCKVHHFADDTNLLHISNSI